MKSRTCVVVGAGITGAAAAWWLTNCAVGWDVTVYEAQPWAGGQLCAAFIGDVPYEPHGAHIFHTGSYEAFSLVRENCELNSYQHEVKTIAGPEQYQLSWPLQVSELRELPEWPQIKRELDERPAHLPRDNFEAYAVGLMGQTLYEWSCYGYTLKQWGMEPRLLSSRFAPKRIDLRDDGVTKMFRDPYEGWCEGGWQTLADNLLRRVDTMLCQPLRLATLPDATAYIITTPLDEFLGADPLPWRGVTTQFHYLDSAGAIMPTAVVNYPSADVLYTRCVETRQMSKCAPDRGTVVGYEFPGAPVKHYPVDDASGENRDYHHSLVLDLKEKIPNAVIAGRLATYSYIDIDQAIIQGLNAARKVARNT